MTPRPASSYSHRARLGLIVPPTNSVNEAEWQQMMPEGVTFHSHRMKLHAAGDASMMPDLLGAIGLLGQVRPDAIAYACTAGSMTTPSSQMPDAASEQSGHRVLTTSHALILALRAVGAKRISVATPYADALNDHEVAFLAAHGIDTLAIAGIGIGAGGPHEYVRIAQTSLADVRAHALATFDPASDALLLACTDFPTLPLIAELEAELGVPVISSNTATLWAMLRACGVTDTVRNGGQLFAA